MFRGYAQNENNNSEKKSTVFSIYLTSNLQNWMKDIKKPATISADQYFRPVVLTLKIVALKKPGFPQ